MVHIGCKIIAKRTGKRRYALDSNHFDGIFLGYKSNMDHLKYWDVKAQKYRTARHTTVDELQYGLPPEQRNAASQHNIQQ